MKRSRTSMLSIVALAVAGLMLAGCSAQAPDGVPAGSPTASVTEAPAPSVADLSGEWKQTNSQSEDNYQVATITGDTLEINWVTDNGDTRSLYWAGTFEAPTVPGSFEWVSANDTAKTEFAMLASGDLTKTFAYDDGEISYEVSALGTTMTVRLGR